MVLKVSTRYWINLAGFFNQTPKSRLALIFRDWNGENLSENINNSPLSGNLTAQPTDDLIFCHCRGDNEQIDIDNDATAINKTK